MIKPFFNIKQFIGSGVNLTPTFRRRVKERSRSNICYFGHSNPFLIDWLIDWLLLNYLPKVIALMGDLLFYLFIIYFIYYTLDCTNRTRYKILSCVLCLFKQVQASGSNDASLLHHELFSLFHSALYF